MEKYIQGDLFSSDKADKPTDKTVVVPAGKNASLDELFVRLSQSNFRSRFALKAKDKAYIQEKGWDTIRQHAADFIRKRLAPAFIPNDGQQTPMRGHPVFIAQHATGCCCRGCFSKWHHIPAGRELTGEEQQYAVAVIMEWIRRQFDPKPIAKTPIHIHMKTILETERLILRELVQEDYNDLCRLLQDGETMYAYEGAFSDQEAQAWLDKQLNRYQTYHFGLWAMIRKDTQEWIGQCGITMQAYKDQEVPEIGYLLQRRYWHQGYATEAAIACREYGFNTLQFPALYSIIRDTNQASQRVALRNGMQPIDTIVKHYRGIYMPHDVFCVRKEETSPTAIP